MTRREWARFPRDHGQRQNSPGQSGQGQAGRGHFFLGALIITKIQLAAMSRIDTPEAERKDFYLYVDEFQEFVASETFDDILSEARKFRLTLVLAHQYIGQLDEKVRKAVFGNAGTVIVFPIGPEDGEFLERYFLPEFNRYDMVSQDKHHIYLKLAIDGKQLKPFSACTLPTFVNFRRQEQRKTIIESSREAHSFTMGQTGRKMDVNLRGRQISLWE